MSKIELSTIICQNIWYIPLPSGATDRKSCHKKAVRLLNGVSMCDRCYNKRLLKTIDNIKTNKKL